MLGKTVAVTMNGPGNLFWAANDRGYIESFKIDGATGKLQVSFCSQCKNRTVVTRTELNSRNNFQLRILIYCSK